MPRLVKIAAATFSLAAFLGASTAMCDEFADRVFAPLPGENSQVFFEREYRDYALQHKPACVRRIAQMVRVQNEIYSNFIELSAELYNKAKVINNLKNIAKRLSAF